MNPLPDPATLTPHVHHDADGYRFEIRSGDESIHENPWPALRPGTAERQADRWITDYTEADSCTRCRMCGYDWCVVSKHLEMEKTV